MSARRKPIVESGSHHGLQRGNREKGPADARQFKVDGALGLRGTWVVEVRKLELPAT